MNSDCRLIISNPKNSTKCSYLLSIWGIYCIYVSANYISVKQKHGVVLTVLLFFLWWVSARVVINNVQYSIHSTLVDVSRSRLVSNQINPIPCFLTSALFAYPHNCFDANKSNVCGRFRGSNIYCDCNKVVEIVKSLLAFGVEVLLTLEETFLVPSHRKIVTVRLW